jgi:hypothetical protein
MESNLKRFAHKIIGNKIGLGLGIAYSLLSFGGFFVGLSYGASCPELGPDVCGNPPFYVAIAASPISFFLIIPHMISWAIPFYFSQQLVLFVNPTFLDEPSADFTGAIIVVGIIVTGLWGVFGAYVQGWIRTIRMAGSTSPAYHYFR